MTHKIIYCAKNRRRIKTVFSDRSLRDFIKKCFKNKWLAIATDGENQTGWVYIHEENGLVWSCV